MDNRLNELNNSGNSIRQQIKAENYTFLFCKLVRGCLKVLESVGAEPNNGVSALCDITRG